ncbi:MAG: NYN domain-containing protein [Candidatus Hodarchaeales archaeon]|jgi:transcriptional regulator NrdR family protein
MSNYIHVEVLEIQHSFNDSVLQQSIYPQRGAVIIDGGYWEALKRSSGNPDVDILRLSDFLCRPAYRLRTCYFDGKDQARQSIHGQLELLERFEVILGDVVERPMNCPNCSSRFTVPTQKRVDVMMAVKIVHLASTKQVDMIVLLAGDRDFLPVVEVAKAAGVVIRLAHGTTELAKVAPSLYRAVDERVHLSQTLLNQFRPLEKTIHKERRKVVETTSLIEQPAIDEKAIDHIIECLDELIKTSGKEWINASDLGLALKQKKILYDGKLVELIRQAKDKIITRQEGTILSVSLPGVEKTVKTPVTSPEDDRAVKFLLETVEELQPRENGELILVTVVGAEMLKKNPNWKEEFGIPKKRALTTVLQKAREQLVIKGKDTKARVGLKASNSVSVNKEKN